ncbi:flagellar motor protein MotB [Caulobacter sp. Root655]|uniref:OmpA family protein n=1 Tax=Caulobacter sp. Root655 TaxID=1736578 RepID=UPI0006F78B5A|nr:OmpA family protein [Caulobacter sp. Root655]KRA64737.1 flagellar motor protein MotB [Caulobacter sp. Root655]
MISGKYKMLAVTALIASGLSLSACATKGFVKEQVGVVNTRVDSTDTKLAEVDRTSQDALKRATDAGKLAEGKFLYSVVLSDDSVKFPLNKHELSPEAQQRLAEFAGKLKEDNKNVYLEVQGFTDATGDTTYNEELGGARAEAVRKFLAKQGVPLNRIATISYGEDDPVAPNDTPDGRAQNRRVVIQVLA